MAEMTQEYLKSILNYDKDSGIFTWVKRNGNVAGNIDSSLYCRINIKGIKYSAHRLAWLYVYGEWPKNQIDHINGNKNDNMISNLRDVTHSENQRNQYKHRLGKLHGCHYCKREEKWVSEIRINNKTKHIGYFNTELDAHNAHIKFKEDL